jgi:hypothetical protein
MIIKNSQLERIYKVMKVGRWKTLRELSAIVNAPPASTSAQLRNLRKSRYGGYTLLRRKTINRAISGLYEYKLVVKKNNSRIKN